MFRRFKPQETPALTPDTRPPTDRPVAVYYRQSSFAQVGNVSTEIQTVDMKAEMIRRGWAEDDVYLIDADAGVSGTLKIDERAGMRQLYDLITDGKIGSVACQDEDRLFRDVTMIQVNIFIEACRLANVQVITPSFTYDFSHSQFGTFHARQFRFKCEMAAEYINTVIRGKLWSARLRMAKEGRWAGWNMPIGFMVDGRSELARGVPNPAYHVYVPFEPYAEVINTYFRIFVETGGSVSGTLKRIYRERHAYPDPEQTPPPPGFKVSYMLKWRGDGFYPGRTGLLSIFTNPAYIGHWCFNGGVMRWNNHEPIVSPDLFWRAFNYLSEYKPDGTKNHNFRPVQQNQRPRLDEARPVDRPLCAGLMFQEYEGKRYQISTLYLKHKGRYTYELNVYNFVKPRMIWRRDATWIDDAITDRFLAKVKQTFKADAWRNATEEYRQNADKERKHKRALIRDHESAQANIMRNLENLDSVKMIKAQEARYDELDQEIERLKAELAALDEEYQQYASLDAMKTTFESAPTAWQHLTRDDRHSLLQIFIDHIDISDHKGNDRLTLVIYWREGSADILTIGKKASSGHAWTPWELERIRTLVSANAGQLEIAAAFPYLKWRQIRNCIHHRHGRYNCVMDDLRGDETYSEYIVRTGKIASEQYIGSDDCISTTDKTYLSSVRPFNSIELLLRINKN